MTPNSFPFFEHTSSFAFKKCATKCDNYEVGPSWRRALTKVWLNFNSFFLHFCCHLKWFRLNMWHFWWLYVAMTDAMNHFKTYLTQTHTHIYSGFISSASSFNSVKMSHAPLPCTHVRSAVVVFMDVTLSICLWAQRRERGADGDSEKWCERN